MVENEIFSKAKNFSMLVPIFFLTVIIYGLSVSILNDTVKSASIAVFQFADDVVSLYGIFIGLIPLGAFHLFILIWLFVVGKLLNGLFEIKETC